MSTPVSSDGALVRDGKLGVLPVPAGSGVPVPAMVPARCEGVAVALAEIGTSVSGHALGLVGDDTLGPVVVGVEELAATSAAGL